MIASALAISAALIGQTYQPGGGFDIGDPDIMPGTPVEVGQALGIQSAFPLEANDAVIRRTDPVGTPNPIPPARNLPDLRGLRVIGWSPENPDTDLYTGSTSDFDGTAAEFVRIDLTFNGLLNPPGTLGVNGHPFEPLEWGDHPVYGYLEIDIDNDHDTGGDIGGGAELKYLANVARFGNLPPLPLANKAAVSGYDHDLNFATMPHFERSGADWEVTFCGCNILTKTSEPTGDGDDVFEEGEVWILTGRVFQRTGGYAQGSLATGGSGPGLYDPEVEVRFYHYNPNGTANDRTLITIVYPMTMAGAALMANETAQAANANVADHNSIEESLVDIIAGADSGQLFGENATLQNGWAGQSPNAGLDTDNWRCTAIFGTSYPDTRPYFFAWTDVAFQTYGDLDGDEMTDLVDRGIIQARIDEVDGTGRDADGVVDGTVTVVNFGPNFFLEDINGDGLIDGADRDDPMYDPPTYPGDVNNDGVVDFTDLNAILANWGNSNDVTHDDGDLDNNGVVDFSDLNEVLANWGVTYP